jgi:hypothetical protein
VTLPAPLVPPDVNMGTNDFFPFYFDRLRKSKWWRRASDTARARNVMMWGEAYKGCPAGSLPDDDDDLAEAAGYGMNVDAFLACKAEIMAPWVLCSDGRYYHPVVCEVVLETWERTSEKRKQDRTRQAARRARLREQTQTDDAGPESVTRDTPPLSRVTPPGVAREIGSQDKTRQENSVASASPLATVEGGKGKQDEPWKADAEFLAFWDSCTLQARRRSSCRKSWAEWQKRCAAADVGQIKAAYRAYLADDPDVQRTGGPGVHIWLKDKCEGWVATHHVAAESWSPERWAVAVKLWSETGDWSDALGPPPGQPACRVPQSVLAEGGFGLRVVQGGAA